MWYKATGLAGAFLCLWLPCISAHVLNGNVLQSISTPKPKSQFFAGVVTGLSPGLVVVSRTIPGRPPEHRTFLVTPQTKRPGGLRLRLRVTVRFQRLIEGDVALEIQVRPKRTRPAATV
ncbi:MAG TPA: hypothetical protein VLJ11_19105 [Bryobacteraceae bacterium]|nr:hypothetical protein [Bryobacteraceae bacterium]